MHTNTQSKKARMQIAIPPFRHAHLSLKYENAKKSVCVFTDYFFTFLNLTEITKKRKRKGAILINRSLT